MYKNDKKERKKSWNKDDRFTYGHLKINISLVISYIYYFDTQTRHILTQFKSINSWIQIVKSNIVQLRVKCVRKLWNSWFKFQIIFVRLYLKGWKGENNKNGRNKLRVDRCPTLTCGVGFSEIQITWWWNPLHLYSHYLYSLPFFQYNYTKLFLFLLISIFIVHLLCCLIIIRALNLTQLPSSI